MIAELDQNAQLNLLENTIREIGQKGEKPLVMGFRDFNADEFD